MISMAGHNCQHDVTSDGQQQDQQHDQGQGPLMAMPGVPITRHETNPRADHQQMPLQMQQDQQAVDLQQQDQQQDQHVDGQQPDQHVDGQQHQDQHVDDVPPELQDQHDGGEQDDQHDAVALGLIAYHLNNENSDEPGMIVIEPNLIFPYLPALLTVDDPAPSTQGEVQQKYAVMLNREEFLQIMRPMRLGLIYESWENYRRDPAIERVTSDGNLYLFLPLPAGPVELILPGIGQHRLG